MANQPVEVEEAISCRRFELQVCTGANLKVLIFIEHHLIIKHTTSYIWKHVQTPT